MRKTIVHFLSDSVQNSVQVDPLSEFFDALKKEDCTRGFVLQKPLQKVLNELDDLLKDKKKKKNKLIIAVKNSLMTLRKTEKNDKNTYAELLWYLSAQNLFDEQNNVFIQYNKNFLHIIGGLFEASIDDDSRHISRMCILEKEQTTLREFYDTIKTDRTNDRETLFEALAVWSLDPELGLNEKFYTQSIRIVQRVETISRQHHQLLHCFLLCLKNINPDLYKTVKKSKEYKKYKLDEKNQSNIEKHQPSKQKSVLGDPNQTQIHSIRKNSGCQSFFLNKLPKNSSSESSEEEKKQNVNKKY